MIKYFHTNIFHNRNYYILIHLVLIQYTIRVLLKRQKII